MFVCGLCFIYSKPGEKATHVVTHIREKIYPYRAAAHHFRDQEGMKCEKDDMGGVGTEIVKEVLACKVCGEATTTTNPILIIH